MQLFTTGDGREWALRVTLASVMRWEAWARRSFFAMAREQGVTLDALGNTEGLLRLVSPDHASLADAVDTSQKLTELINAARAALEAFLSTPKEPPGN